MQYVASVHAYQNEETHSCCIRKAFAMIWECVSAPHIVSDVSYVLSFGIATSSSLDLTATLYLIHASLHVLGLFSPKVEVSVHI